MTIFANKKGDGVMPFYCIGTLAKHAILCLGEDDPTVMFATCSFFARVANAVGGSLVSVFGVKMLAYGIRSIEREEV